VLPVEVVVTEADVLWLLEDDVVVAVAVDGVVILVDECETGGIVVASRPLTPMIVCATPSASENTPLPVSQLQDPSFTPDWQQYCWFPQADMEPSSPLP
jgi:hypothetical protein